jgi:hypothetical protein
MEITNITTNLRLYSKTFNSNSLCCIRIIIKDQHQLLLVSQINLLRITSNVLSQPVPRSKNHLLKCKAEVLDTLETVLIR